MAAENLAQLAVGADVADLIIVSEAEVSHRAELHCQLIIVVATAPPPSVLKNLAREN